MRYQGGKSRIAKDISEIILKYSDKFGGGNTFVSLFCGGCSIETLVTPHFDKVICNDINEYLIALFSGVQAGYILPDTISEEQYKYVKEHKDEDKTLTGFVGFGCSFGGRFFQGYARSSDKRNYAKQSKNSITKEMKVLSDVEFVCKDYKDVIYPPNSVIYADPPYNGTTSYRYTDKFDSDEFWNYMDYLSQNHLVFISEHSAPDNYVSIWEKEVKRHLNNDPDKRFLATEKLFIHKNWLGNN